jgi:hypothetical protein
MMKRNGNENEKIKLSIKILLMSLVVFLLVINNDASYAMEDM